MRFAKTQAQEEMINLVREEENQILNVFEIVFADLGGLIMLRAQCSGSFGPSHAQLHLGASQVVSINTVCPPVSGDLDAPLCLVTTFW